MPSDPADGETVGGRAPEPVSGGQGEPPPPGPPAAPKRLFPADNWWNLTQGAPLDPSSNHQFHWLGRIAVRLGQQLPASVRDRERQLPEGAVSKLLILERDGQVRIPSIRSDAAWLDGRSAGTIDNPVPGGDWHLIVVDVDTSIFTRSTSSTQRDGSPRRCPTARCSSRARSTASAAMWDMKTNDTRPDGWTSSDAADSGPAGSRAA
jgi:hypothetical protein